MEKQLWRYANATLKDSTRASWAVAETYRRAELQKCGENPEALLAILRQVVQELPHTDDIADRLIRRSEVERRTTSRNTWIFALVILVVALVLFISLVHFLATSPYGDGGRAAAVSALLPHG